MPVSRTEWSVGGCSWSDAVRVGRELRIPHTAAMVLASRGLGDPTTAREFLECSAPLPDPFLFTHMQDAVRAILATIEGGKQIVVHGDYDADGITATALMLQGLRRLGAKVDWYLPSRFNEGYGLSRTAVETVAAQGAELLITVDCGVNYPDEVAAAKDLGLEVIVIDHHEPGAQIPECLLIHHTQGEYPHGDLCGVGLALKVLHGVYVESRGAERHRLPEDIVCMLDLVAIGTVADLASLQGENRYYVREGLRFINLGQRLGLRALCEVSNCTGAVDSGGIAFRIAPRLNAAGRLSDPSPPLRLLLSEEEAEARRLAGELHELNGARQDLERAMLDDALAKVQAMASLPKVIVLADAEWHEGVVGIVASRLVEQFHRPAVLLRVRDGVAKGSGRSIPAYDLLGGISSCGHLLSVFGGHAQAAGVTLAEQNIEEFRAALESHASLALSERDLVPVYRADAVLCAEDLVPDTARALAMMEPFGSGNARPRFLGVDARLRQVQPTRNGIHLRGTAEVGGVRVPFIGFGMGRTEGRVVSDVPCFVGGQVRADEWRGALRTQLVLEEVSAELSGKPVPGSVSTGDDCEASTDVGAQDSGERIEAEAGVSGRENGLVSWPDSARDRRGRPGRLTDLAQVLATGETTVLVVNSVERTAEVLRSRLPSIFADRLAFDRPGREGTGGSGETAGGGEVRVVEWRCVPRLIELLQACVHVVVLDPPYRVQQMETVSKLAERGAFVHLLYGETERRSTRALLRYTVHPRFAMVCMYNAMRSGGVEEEVLLDAAGRLAWDKGKVVLTQNSLKRALTILDEVGLRSQGDGKAKLDVRKNATYREAEADYEECVRSCLTL